jgi:hypothetical protein
LAKDDSTIIQNAHVDRVGLSPTYPRTATSDPPFSPSSISSMSPSSVSLFISLCPPFYLCPPSPSISRFLQRWSHHYLHFFRSSLSHQNMMKITMFNRQTIKNMIHTHAPYELK